MLHWHLVGRVLAPAPISRLGQCQLQRKLHIKFQVSPGSWVKKSGLVAMLRKARRDTLDPAPCLDLLGRSISAGNGHRKSAHPQPGLHTIAAPGRSRDEHAEMAEAELSPPQRQDYATLKAKIDLLSATVAQIMSQREVTSATGMAAPAQLGPANDVTSGFHYAPLPGTSGMTHQTVPVEGSAPAHAFPGSSNYVNGIPSTPWPMPGLPRAPPNAAHAFPKGLPQPGVGQSRSWYQINSAQPPFSVLGSAPQGNLRFWGASQQYAPPALSLLTTSRPWEPPDAASYAGLLQNSGGVSADSLPQIDIVSPQLRADILAGKDVNLALLLIPGFKSQEDPNQCHLVVDGDVYPLKGLADSRQNKKLTIQESIQAFTICIFLLNVHLFIFFLLCDVMLFKKIFTIYLKFILHLCYFSHR